MVIGAYVVQRRSVIEGPFSRSPQAKKATAVEMVVAAMIWRRRGRGDPVSIADLCAVTGKDQRTIKGIVEELIMTHGMTIGAIRGPRPGSGEAGPGAGVATGYFMIQDREDLEAACRPYEAQINSMTERVQRLRTMASDRKVK